MSEGRKFDNGKSRWDLVPYEQFQQVVDILTFGAEKYEPNNWKDVQNPQDRYFSALMRHIVAWKKGDKKDAESKKSHLAHAICNCLFLMYFDDEEEVCVGEFFKRLNKMGGSCFKE